MKEKTIAETNNMAFAAVQRGFEGDGTFITKEEAEAIATVLTETSNLITQLRSDNLQLTEQINASGNKQSV